MNLSIANVFTVSVSQPGQGIGEYNTSNIGLLSHEVPANTFGNLGYKLYLEPTEIGKDFGTNSITYRMGVAIFSQQPNILGPGGYLAVLLTQNASQEITFPATPVSGTFVLNFGGNPSAPINWNDSSSIIQQKLRGIAGLEGAVVTGNIPAGILVKPSLFGPQALLTVSSNTLVDAGSAAVVPAVASEDVGETLEEAILRTGDLVEYFGILATAIVSEEDMLDAAAVVQALRKLLFVVSNNPDDVEEGGTLDLLRTGNLNQTRGLFYGGENVLNSLSFMAAYAGRGLSVDFNGSNTTLTMHLKDLIGIQPDPTMTQTLLNLCQAAGADAYVSIQGVPKVFTSGENEFFDRVYNRLWFVGALQVAGFNLFAQTSTKIPQTENGMDSLKSVLRQVCEQAVTNQYGAPGRWTSPSTFGNQEDLLANVLQRGYYLYSQPIAQQSVAARENREAPLVQLAFKEAGAMHSGSIIVNINQ